MKISREKLRQIIKEELDSVVNEMTHNDSLKEVGPGDPESPAEKTARQGDDPVSSGSSRFDTKASVAISGDASLLRNILIKARAAKKQFGVQSKEYAQENEKYRDASLKLYQKINIMLKKQPGARQTVELTLKDFFKDGNKEEENLRNWLLTGKNALKN